MIDLLREYQRLIDTGPPVVARIIARHDVPFGGAYRMWTTGGDLIVYVNRGWVADLPRSPRKASGFGFDATYFAGIPVLVE